MQVNELESLLCAKKDKEFQNRLNFNQQIKNAVC